MLLIIIEIIIILIGLAVTPVLFYRFPRLPGNGSKDRNIPKVSVIIPARNEEKNLPLLLEDLLAQSIVPYEIICVDDDSSDATASIAKSFGVKVLSLYDKPEGWTGKTWACQNGADAAKGELLLFLDADVRLGRNGILRLIQAYADYGCTVSVQPYHNTEKAYEQYSVLFNLIQIAANGTALPKPLSIGLYGPVIFISKSEYNKMGGHASVRKSVVEDMALGQRLKEAGFQYRLFIGDKEISFRMYGGGVRSLFQGWVKNIASGAVRTPQPLFWMVFFWISSMTSVPVHMIRFAVSGTISWLAIYSVLYIVWAAILIFLSKKAGHFRLLTIVFYPILIAALIVVFAVSMFKKIFGLKVKWKGRAIAGEDKPCK